MTASDVEAMDRCCAWEAALRLRRALRMVLIKKAAPAVLAEAVAANEHPVSFGPRPMRDLVRRHVQALMVEVLKQDFLFGMESRSVRNAWAVGRPVQRNLLLRTMGVKKGE